MKNRSFRGKNVSLQHILHVMNDIFTVEPALLRTFAADFFTNYSTNKKRKSKWKD